MINSRKGRMDKLLLLCILAICLFGILSIYSATYDPARVGQALNPIVMKQMIWVAAGLVLLFIISNIDYRNILNFAYLIYGANLVLLVLLLVFGATHYGAKRWLDFGPVSIQPSEFVKITVVLALASFLQERRENAGSLGNFIGAVLIVMPAFLLIFIQPDLGTSLVLIPILFAVLYVCGENIKYILFSIIGGIMSLPFMWGLLKDYQKSRLMVFINPNIDPLGAGYTIIQSKIATGSGGLFGKGWLNGTQSYLKFLPERHTDFIFSVVGEEWGYAGASAIVLIFALIFLRGLRAVAEAPDPGGKAIGTGIVTLLAFQVLVNISMTIGMMPVVGLPLPAISYGGSNLITTVVGVGLLLSLSRSRMR